MLPALPLVSPMLCRFLLRPCLDPTVSLFTDNLVLLNYPSPNFLAAFKALLRVIALIIISPTYILTTLETHSLQRCTCFPVPFPLSHTVSFSLTVSETPLVKIPPSPPLFKEGSLVPRSLETDFPDQSSILPVLLLCTSCCLDQY